MIKKLFLFLALTTIVGACENYGPDGSPQGFYDNCTSDGSNEAGCAFGTFGYAITYFFTNTPVE